MSGNTKYTTVAGIAPLRQAISDDLQKRKNVNYAPNQIVVTNGAKQAIIQALMAVVEPEDDVLIPAPYWTSYPDMVRLCRANPVIMETCDINNYKIDPIMLREVLQGNTKIKSIIICNPSNPTGCVMEIADLEAIAAVLKDFPLVTVFADEIYEHLTYQGVKHHSIAAIEGMYDRTVTINGFSKSHSMTGLRLGYAAGPTHVINACSKIQSQFTSCASSISQYAGSVALTKVPDQWMSDRVAELDEKRQLAYNMMTEIPQVTCPLPVGAFYLLPDVSAYYNTVTLEGVPIDNAKDICMQLLSTKAVAVVPGEAFGASNCIRLSYATSQEVIRESITRMKEFLLSLKSK
jgi:aspartate/methionine/tyrosine aminotransferase